MEEDNIPPIIKTHWSQSKTEVMSEEIQFARNTPGQYDEAIEWMKKEEAQLIETVFSLQEPEGTIIRNGLVSMFFKLKQSSFALKPTEFIFGIEYKDKQAVINGAEAVNIALQNPGRNDQREGDRFAFQIAQELLNRLSPRKTINKI